MADKNGLTLENSARQVVQPRLRLRLPGRVRIALACGIKTSCRPFGSRSAGSPANDLAGELPYESTIERKVDTTVSIAKSHQRSQKMAHRFDAAT